MPDRNIERLLRTTNVPVTEFNDRRLDIIVSGLRAKKGVPLFCDLTILSPVSANGNARSGCSNSSGKLLIEAACMVSNRALKLGPRCGRD